MADRLGGSHLKSLLRVLRYIRPYWRLAALTFGAAAVAAAVELLPPWLVKIIIDDVIGDHRPALLPLIIGALLLAHAGKNVAASLRIRFNNTLEQQVVYDLRSEVYAALQRLSVSYYENRSTGEIMSRINNDVEHVERIFIDGLESLLMSSLTLIVYHDALTPYNDLNETAWGAALVLMVLVLFVNLGSRFLLRRQVALAGKL